MLGFGLIGKLFGDKQNVVEAPVTEQAQAQPRAASQIKDRIAAIREQYTEERRNYGYTKGHNGIVTVSNQQFLRSLPMSTSDYSNVLHSTGRLTQIKNINGANNRLH